MAITINEFTQEQAQALYEKTVETHIRGLIAKQVQSLTPSTAEAMIRKAMVDTITEYVPMIREKARVWLAANLDAAIERKAQQLIEEAIGDFKRRIVGRT